MRRTVQALSVMLALAGAAGASAHEAKTAGSARVYGLPPAVVPQQIAVSDRVDGPIYFSAGNLGAVGRMDRTSGAVEFIALGPTAKPTGIVLSPRGQLVILDRASDTIVWHDPDSGDSDRFGIEGRRHLELHSAVADPAGRVWFTGYAGFYGWFEPGVGKIKLYAAPGGRGPAAMALGGEGAVWYVSPVRNTVTRIDGASGRTRTFPLPRDAQGPKGIVVDRLGGVWISAIKSGALARLDPANESWSVYRLPSSKAKPYGLAMDGEGRLWVSDVGEDRLWMFDPKSGQFSSRFASLPNARPRHVAIAGGTVWLTESAADRLVSVSKPEALSAH